MVKQKRLSTFISHNKADKNVATNIAIFLTSESIDVWFDEWEISAGDSIIDEIENGLKKCTHFIIIWSKNAKKSKWVRKELKSALMDAIQKDSLKIIPILLDDTPLPPLLKDLRYIKYHGGSEDDRRELVESITGHKPSTTFARAIVKKYHEIVYKEPEGGEPFGIKFCPSCGSSKLKGGSFIDYQGDEEYFTLTCEDCGWSDFTQ